MLRLMKLFRKQIALRISKGPDVALVRAGPAIIGLAVPIIAALVGPRTVGPSIALLNITVRDRRAVAKIAALLISNASWTN